MAWPGGFSRCLACRNPGGMPWAVNLLNLCEPHSYLATVTYLMSGYMSIACRESLQLLSVTLSETGRDRSDNSDRARPETFTVGTVILDIRHDQAPNAYPQ